MCEVRRFLMRERAKKEVRKDRKEKRDAYFRKGER